MVVVLAILAMAAIGAGVGQRLTGPPIVEIRDRYGVVRTYRIRLSPAEIDAWRAKEAQHAREMR